MNFQTFIVLVVVGIWLIVIGGMIDRVSTDVGSTKAIVERLYFDSQGKQRSE